MKCDNLNRERYSENPKGKTLVYLAYYRYSIGKNLVLG